MRCAPLTTLLLCAMMAGANAPARTVDPAEAVTVPQPPAGPPPYHPALQQLAAEFFAWRATQQPVSGDPLMRVERPDGWLPAWSREDLAIYRVQFRDFLVRLEALDRSGFSRADEVDALLLAAAIKRVGWELDMLRMPHRNPLFYVHQTLGTVLELLVLGSPVTPQRIDAIAARLNHFPVTVAQAKDNLTDPAQPFAVAAVEALADVEDRLAAVRTGIDPLTPDDRKASLDEATGLAAAALADYRTWLQRRLPEMAPEFAIGPDAYQWFLAHVALIPHTPEEVQAQGRLAWHQAVARDLLETHRNRDLPDLPLFDSVEVQVRASFQYQQEIRAFLEARDLMSVPDGLMQYRNRPLPDYLAPLQFLGTASDLTSARRLDEDAVGYLPEPDPDLPFFHRASARDPRPVLVHRGVPGHYFQLAQSWTHPDPIRRRTIDPGTNDGIACYVEELLLQSGLWEFSPRSREILRRFMRLWALKVEVDIRMATGRLTVAEAAEHLARTVPMDRETAAAEAVHAAAAPGRAIGCQIGKLQILEFLADAQLDQGDEFSLRQFHDHLMRDGNVPVALRRWEYLGRDDQVRRLRELAAPPATVPR